MTPLTSDPDDPRLTHGADSAPGPQAEVYLVLSEEERAKGFVRPLRRAYRHVGPPGSETPAVGRYWTQAQLDAVGGGCGEVTSMGLALCETYARQPGFYGATYCCTCQMHRPVSEFVWVEDGERVGS